MQCPIYSATVLLISATRSDVSRSLQCTKQITATVQSQIMCKFVLSELRQISTNFDNFSQKDGKEAKIMRGALIFHLN